MIVRVTVCFCLLRPTTGHLVANGVCVLFCCAEPWRGVYDLHRHGDGGDGRCWTLKPRVPFLETQLARHYAFLARYLLGQADAPRLTRTPAPFGSH